MTFSALSAVYVRFMFGSLVCSF